MTTTNSMIKMGFGFNLIGFPLLIVSTVGLLIYFAATENKTALKILGSVWIVAIVVGATSLIREHYQTPLRLTKQEIIGNYRIDKRFYPGKNTDWQYDHYRFTITPTDSIYFYLTNKNTILKTFKGKLKYSSGPPDLWSIQSDTTYHVIKYRPLLHRGNRKFYYVFHSDIYGNMFFRKEN